MALPTFAVVRSGVLMAILALGAVIDAILLALVEVEGRFAFGTEPISALLTMSIRLLIASLLKETHRLIDRLRLAILGTTS